MGRAFVRPEYQRNHSPLMLLWKGIGQYVARNPHYSILFGPISISNDYNPTSRQMMVRFLAENRLMPELARLVQPRSPFRGATRLESSAMLLKDIEDVAHSVSDIEHDDKGVPVLLRQYLKLGAKVLSFNVDASFGNVIDGLVVVDLLGVEQGILERYMGRDEARRFIAHHTASQEKEPGHRTVAEPRPAFAA
jgi:putative hemolysin